MQRYFVTKKVGERGFTLAETMTALAVTSVLGLLAAPSFVSWNNQNRVKAGIETIAGALQEVKGQVQRQSKRCTLILESDKIKSNNSGCLSSSRNLPEKITLATNIAGTPPAVSFSFKGNVVGLTTSDPTVNIGVIVVSMPAGTNEKLCLLISDGLGMTRTGVYQGTLTNITQDKCVTQ